ncbi:MAG TPA: hypothetical protein VHE12_13780 [bacterium]|nr:hypothetical protein [bacterium]
MKYPMVRQLFVILLLGAGLSAIHAWADTEIDLGDGGPTPASQPTAVPTAQPVLETTHPSPVPEMKAEPTPTAEVTVEPEAGQDKKSEEEPAETTQIVHGTLKMKDVYAAGIKNYQEQDYDSAIRELKRALEMNDPYTQKFYYAEAAAMLGVIYQFRVIHYDKALHYYKLALHYEKKNRTALRHLKEVQRLIKKGK